MEVKGITDSSISSFRIENLKTNEAVKETLNENTDAQNSDTSNSTLKNNLLSDTINKLENNIHMNDIHPLDNKSSLPINSFKEAINELNFIKTDKFKTEALFVHANINPGEILDLFVK
ncbi:MAG: hypothetical protein ABSG15_02955 [FCB group bacterium]|jgi:hypothetical protein